MLTNPGAPHLLRSFMRHLLLEVPNTARYPFRPDRQAIGISAFTMYRSNDFDKAFIPNRAAQLRDQIGRWQSGKLSEDEFRSLCLQNGWYVQRHAPMRRVAVPYGELPNDADPLAYAAEIAEASRVELHFPTFTDGRAYSIRHGGLRYQQRR